METPKKSPPRFLPKSRIDHAVFGLGTIVEVNDLHTTIAFDQAGTRKFITSLVQLVASDAPAPAAPAKRKKEPARS
jgi:hypothetical protein